MCHQEKGILLGDFGDASVVAGSGNRLPSGGTSASLHPIQYKNNIRLTLL